jgi:hypothetical protein
MYIHVLHNDSMLHYHVVIAIRLRMQRNVCCCKCWSDAIVTMLVLETRL